MCCIFTCCGWFLDLVNRAITFTMSCTIVAAACCAFLVAGTAGVALGYNYSIAEYMDLRETSVQVHDNAITKVRGDPEKPKNRKVKQETRVDIKLRRGVFDDDLQEDLNVARRSGDLPPPSIKEDGVARSVPEEADPDLPPPPARRRLEDIVGEEPARYESNLKRLTGGPIASPPPSTIVSEYSRTAKPFDHDDETADRRSIDRLKAIQSLINSKKDSASGRRAGLDKIKNVYDTTPELDSRLFPPEFKEMPQSARKAFVQPDSVSSLHRLAVPARINLDEWRQAAKAKADHEPKQPSLMRGPVFGIPEDYDLVKKTYPPPIKLQIGPERPTRPAGPPTWSPSTKPQKPYPGQWPPPTSDEPLESFTENRLLPKFDSRKQLMDELSQNANRRPADYYEDSEGSHGIPA